LEARNSELAALALRPEDVAADEDTIVWLENWPSLSLFIEMQTQWRTGAVGVTGLDYGALPVVMDFNAIAADQRRAFFEDIRTMEIAFLESLRSNQ
jgi:uncharacterized protein DUF1799